MGGSGSPGFLPLPERARKTDLCPPKGIASQGRADRLYEERRLTTIAGASHAVVSDNPDGFADQLFPFLSQLCLHGAPPATVVQLSSAAGQSEAQKSLC